MSAASCRSSACTSSAVSGFSSARGTSPPPPSATAAPPSACLLAHQPSTLDLRGSTRTRSPLAKGPWAAAHTASNGSSSTYVAGTSPLSGLAPLLLPRRSATAQPSGGATPWSSAMVSPRRSRISTSASGSKSASAVASSVTPSSACASSAITSVSHSLTLSAGVSPPASAAPPSAAAAPASSMYDAGTRPRTPSPESTSLQPSTSAPGKRHTSWPSDTESSLSSSASKVAQATIAVATSRYAVGTRPGRASAAPSSCTTAVHPSKALVGCGSSSHTTSPELTLSSASCCAAKSARMIAGAARLESCGSGSTYDVGTKPDSSPRMTRLHPSLTGAPTTRSTSS